MYFLKFVFTGVIFLFFLKIFKFLIFFLFSKKKKSKNFKEGDVFIFKNESVKKILKIDAETIDFEEIKKEK